MIDVDDDHALADADLRRRQPDAGRRVHGVGHVAQQLVDLPVDVRDVVRRLLQHRRRELENASQRHARYS